MGSVESAPGRVEATAVLESTGLAPAPIDTVRRWWTDFRQKHPRLGVGAASFVAFFGRAVRELPGGGGGGGGALPAARSEEVLRRVFASLDKSGCGAVDGLELFAALALLARGTLEDRAAFLFALFDFAGHGRLDCAALGLLIERASSGLQKTCSCLGLRVPKDLPYAMAGRCFRGRSADDISFAEYRDWWHGDGLVRTALQKFVAATAEEEGLPELDGCSWEHYKELDAVDIKPGDGRVVEWDTAQWIRSGALSTVPESSERGSLGEESPVSGSWPPRVQGSHGQQRAVASHVAAGGAFCMSPSLGGAHDAVPEGRCEEDETAVFRKVPAGRSA